MRNIKVKVYPSASKLKKKQQELLKEKEFYLEKLSNL